MKTNYERLHEMSIEEMAQHLAREQFMACASFIKGLDEELLPWDDLLTIKEIEDIINEL